VADNKEQFDKENSPEFSDEAMRRFLFGSLSAAEQLAFEERLFVDDRFEARVRRAECELTDDYAFERLSIAERELFEHRFLVSTGRQQKLRLSRVLREHFAAASNVTQTVSLRAQPVQRPSRGIMIGEGLQRLLGLNQPSWRLVLSVVILIVLVGTIWSVLQSPGIRNRFITKRRPAPAASPVTNQQESHHPTKASPTPLSEETSSPPEQKGPAFATDEGSVVLVPGGIYDPDRIPRVSLPDGELATVRVQLAIKTNRLETYRAELLTVAGQSVFSEGSLKSATGNAPIEFEVPVRVLKAGDYQVKLSRVTDGIEEGVATYYFRVE